MRSFEIPGAQKIVAKDSLAFIWASTVTYPLTMRENDRISFGAIGLYIYRKQEKKEKLNNRRRERAIFPVW